MSLHAYPVRGIGTIRQGMDIAEVIRMTAVRTDGPGLRDGDVVVVTSKIVSKAEGRVFPATERDSVVAAETVEVVSSWETEGRRSVVARTRNGLVLAAAGVDSSNTDKGTVLALPLDPDGSARRLRERLAPIANVAVVISDTMGRPWRVGQVDNAIGLAGMAAVDDHRGQPDMNGRPLDVTMRAIPDEAASAAELAAGKSTALPVTILRGLADHVLPTGVHGPGAVGLVRDPATDRFRLGTTEAARQAVLARRTVREFSATAVDPAAVRRAIAAAITAPAPHHSTPWRFVLVETPDAANRLLDAMLEAWVADLRADGFDEAAVRRRTSRGGVLRRAPYLVVPCLVDEAAHHYPDPRRADAERSMFLLAMGASIENLLIALSAEGLGSAWVSSTLFCPDVATEALGLPPGWQPMGSIAIGEALVPPAPRPDLAIDALVLKR